MRGLPNTLSALRLALAPVLLALAWSGAPRAFVCCLALSLMTDIADGRIARRTGQASERGAVLDSWADLATYASLPLSAWWLRPEFVRAEAVFLLVAVASYVAPVAIGFLRYGRLTSYHTRGARLAAYLGGASTLVVFAGGPALPFRIATAVLVLAELEEIAITAVLPEWHANVPSLAHALALRGCGSTESRLPSCLSTTAAQGSTRTREAATMKCTSVVVLLGAWFIMIPPETVNWHCARVQHDGAPMEQWKPSFRFETQSACEALRSELVRRESNPRRREAARAHRAEMDRKYRQTTPLHVRVLEYLWFCGRGAWQPLDFFGHTRCAYRAEDTITGEKRPLRRPAADAGPEGGD